MQHDQFIGQVQNRARLDSRGAAEQATRATLETLAARIPDGLAENLAAQLPPEIGEHLRRKSSPAGEGSGERFDRQEFVRRVADTGAVDEPTAAYQARVVMEVVDDATSGQIVNRVYEALPEELAGLLRAGSAD